MSEEIECKGMKIESYFETIFVWVFQTLMKFKNIEEVEIFRLAHPLTSIFMREVFSDPRV